METLVETAAHDSTAVVHGETGQELRSRIRALRPRPNSRLEEVRVSGGRRREAM
jgi:hypothetical protein